MKFLNDIFKKIEPVFRKALVVFRLDADKNWISMVSFFLIITVIIFTQSALRFYRISSDDASLVENQTGLKPNTLNRGAIKDTLSEFSIKEENYKELKRSRPRFVDPSL